MKSSKKSRRPASGWPKGWEIIGGDVVDYEAALDFDAVILGKQPMSSEIAAASQLGVPEFWNTAKNRWELRDGTAISNPPGVTWDATAPKASMTALGSPRRSEAEGLPRQGRQEDPAEARQARSEAVDPLDP
jgi:hypothetical protein